MGRWCRICGQDQRHRKSGGRGIPWLKQNEPELFELAMKADLFAFDPTPLDYIETEELDFEEYECVNEELSEAWIESQEIKLVFL